MYQLQCSEVWGGIKNEDIDACSRTITASLYSSACGGGKGGDIYYVSVCGQDAITRLAVADVVGHGEAVSEVSGWLYKSLRDRINGLEGDSVLSDLNDMAAERGDQAMTTAAVVGVCTANERAYFSYAGHHPVLLRRKGSHIWESMVTRGDGIANLPLGVLPAAAYRDHAVPVHAGDQLVLYTDGIIETPSPTGDLFGAERLHAVLTELDGASPFELKTGVLEAVRRHAGDRPLDHDDVTLLAVEVR